MPGGGCSRHCDNDFVRIQVIFEWVSARRAEAAAGSRDTVARVINERVEYVWAAAAFLRSEPAELER